MVQWTISSDERRSGARPSATRGRDAASSSERQPPGTNGNLHVEFHNHRHVIAGFLPAAHLFDDLVRLERALQAGARPDMIQAAAAVGSFPIGGAIAPPAVNFLLRRDELAG